ncbi:MAG: AAA family ATPase [Saprospiraceae bacterium]
MKSPFKFLDAYAPEDREAFFGRDEEVAALYDMVAKNRLILVYGQSGTGKTSLIQCGLAAKFDATDWYPIFVRRQNDLNAALEQRLAAVVGGLAAPNATEALQTIFETFLRPVYLVFDQLEEVFVLGTPEERARFMHTIRDILESSVPCRVVFVIREEYLAYLYGFEQVLPTLFDRRLRVEPMSIAKVRTVLHGSFQRFNIRVQAPEGDTMQQIIDNVSGGRAGIQLPYLQVYLDTLYREDFRRSYPDRENKPGEWLPLELSRSEVAALGQIENVLERFLHQQKSAIQRQMRTEFPEIADDAVEKVLDAFVSEEGTKRPVEYSRTDRGIRVDARWAPLFQPLPDDVLGRSCQLLEQARLLRFADRHIELAHDALAALIDGQRSDQQRRLQEATARLLSNFREFRDTGEFLTRKQINYLDDLWPVLEPRLDEPVRVFVKKSEEHVRQTEQAELEAERHKRRQARRVAIVGMALAAAALLGFVLAWFQYLKADEARLEIARKALEAQRNTATALKVEGKYPEALAQLAGTQQFASVLTKPEQEQIKRLTADWRAVYRHMNAGDSLSASGNLLAALDRYRQAQGISPDDRIDNRIGQTTKDIERKFKEYMLFGEALFNAKKYNMALENYQKALRLKPDDAEAKQRAGNLPGY